jgi:glycosyltransferase involved in cell wall biosynthesis
MKYNFKGGVQLKKILIVQPYIPKYRRKFFSMLETSCNENGMELSIFAPAPDKVFRLRGDASSDSHVVREIRVFRFKVMGKQVDYFRFPRGVRFTDFDLVIMEQTLKNIQYPLLLLQSRKKTKIALWGHGKTIVKKKSRAEEFLQLFLSKRADFFFSYTTSGANYLAENGFPKSKLIVLQNSNSSSERLNQIDSISTRVQTRSRYTGFHCCFIGALEETKGIHFLLKALPVIKQSLPDFEFTFIGDGPDKNLIIDFVEANSYVSWLGFRNQSDLDEICQEYSLILNPGRVGLIAVDSLFLLLPIVTISGGYHAPEYEYIQNNGTSVEVNGTFQDYALEVIRLLNNPEELEKMRELASSLRGKYTIEVMVKNFTTGIELCLVDSKI